MDLGAYAKPLHFALLALVVIAWGAHELWDYHKWKKRRHAERGREDD
jgi:hypothetical protein